MTDLTGVTTIAGMRSDRRIPDVEDFRFRTEVEVRFRDLDAMGHVNDAVILTYLEVARTAYMTSLGHAPAGAPPAELFPFIISDMEVRFLAPALLGDVLIVHIRADQVGKKDFLFDYLVTTKADNRPVASAQSRQVCFDHGALSSLEVPAELRRLLEEREGRKLLKNRGAA